MTSNGPVCEYIATYPVRTSSQQVKMYLGHYASLAVNSIDGEYGANPAGPFRAFRIAKHVSRCSNQALEFGPLSWTSIIRFIELAEREISSCLRSGRDNLLIIAGET